MWPLENISFLVMKSVAVVLSAEITVTEQDPEWNEHTL
jgi:hypothetical protein